MVPPFLAYYGVLTSNRSLVLEAYNQLSLYRNYLLDPSTGLWHHVALSGQGDDPGLWSTGAFVFFAAACPEVLKTKRQCMDDDWHAPRAVHYAALAMVQVFSQGTE
jgi:hypothetical protein